MFCDYKVYYYYYYYNLICYLTSPEYTLDKMDSSRLKVYWLGFHQSEHINLSIQNIDKINLVLNVS